MSYISQHIYQIRTLVRASRSLPWEKVPPVHPNTVRVIYNRASPLWARWANVIVALDVMMVTSIIEYTWDISGTASRTKVAPVEKAETIDSEAETLPVHLAEHMQMQPFWKKTFFTGIFLSSGIMFAVAILASRARLLRTVTLAKAGPGPSARHSGTLYFETASHPVGYGVALPLKDCSIAKGDAPSQLFLRVTGLGGWQLNLKGATIKGQTMPKDKITASREAMLRAWNVVGGRVEAPNAKR